MSLNHIVNADIDADFKSLKVNGVPVPVTTTTIPPLVIYTPTLTGISLQNFTDLSASYIKNGKILTIQCRFKAKVIGQPFYVQVTVSLPPGETVKTGVPYLWGIFNGSPEVEGDSIWCNSLISSLPTSCSMYLSANKRPNFDGLFYWSGQFIVEVE